MGNALSGLAHAVDSLRSGPQSERFVLSPASSSALFDHVAGTLVGVLKLPQRQENLRSGFGEANLPEPLVGTGSSSDLVGHGVDHLLGAGDFLAASKIERQIDARAQDRRLKFSRARKLTRLLGKSFSRGKVEEIQTRTGRHREAPGHQRADLVLATEIDGLLEYSCG